MPQPHPPIYGHALGLPLAPDATGEPRMFDITLAKALGFDRPRKIRELIQRKRDELASFGSLAEVDLDVYGQPVGGSPTAGLPPSGCEAQPLGGSATVALPPTGSNRGFLLNERQVILLAILSDAPRSAEVRHQVVEVFAAWRAGRSPAPPATDVDLVASMGEADRLADFDLAKHLGFADPYGIRDMIKRHRGALLERGDLVQHVVATGMRGRPRTPFLLNRAQCVFLAEVVALPVSARPQPTFHRAPEVDPKLTSSKATAPCGDNPTTLNDLLRIVFKILDTQGQLITRLRSIEAELYEHRPADMAFTSGMFGRGGRA